MKRFLMDGNLMRKNYELTEEESFAAHAGDSVTPEVKSYTGFSAPEKQTVEVLR